MLQALVDNAPWLPVQSTLQAAAAVKAMARGEASPDQQKFLLDWWINTACRTYDEHYFPGDEDGRRNTDYALGRAFPGRQTVKLMKINIDDIKRGEKNR